MDLLLTVFGTESNNIDVIFEFISELFALKSTA